VESKKDEASKGRVLALYSQGTDAPQFSFSWETPSALLTPDEIFGLDDPQELIRRLEESRCWERKPPGIHGRALGEYCSMWANTAPNGGLVAVGIEDNGKISGCHALSQDQLNAIEKASHIYCSEAKVNSRLVPVRSVDGKESFIVLLRAFYHEDKVVFDSAGNAFMRVGDSKHKLTIEEIRELQNDKGQLAFEQETCGLEFPADFDSTLLRNFVDGIKRLRGIEDWHNDADILRHRHLGKIKDGVFVPNNACALLLAIDPLASFPGCKILFLRVNGEFELSGDKYNIVKRISIEGPIPHLIDKAATVIEAQLREFSRLGSDGKFFSAPEYPKPAWYEALVNACVHRSYGLRNMNIFVKMFDDKLVIESPGGFPPSITPETIYGSHSPRNPHLMDAMFYLDLVKEHGEGTRRMRDSMSDMNLPSPEFRQTVTGTGASSVQVTLRNDLKQRHFFVDKDAAAIFGEGIFRSLTSEEKRILNFVAEHGNINVSECLRLVPTLPKWHSAKRLLESMRVKGYLHHRHSTNVLRDAHACYILPVRQVDSSNERKERNEK
jgi:ATP-dependent DNA helicase RecG